VKLTTNSLPKKINTIHYLLILGLILGINLPIYSQSECDGSLPENISFENVPPLCQQYSNLDFDYCRIQRITYESPGVWFSIVSPLERFSQDSVKIFDKPFYLFFEVLF
jgi:hypothetical protein